MIFLNFKKKCEKPKKQKKIRYSWYPPNKKILVVMKVKTNIRINFSKLENFLLNVGYREKIQVKNIYT